MPLASGPATRLMVLKDYICPFCYFALGEWDQLDAKPEAIRPVSVLLLPNLPAEGLNIPRYDAMRGLSPETRARNNQFFADEAARVGLPWVKRENIFYSRPAHVFAKWAVAEEIDPFEIDRAIFGAYYGRGEDIGATTVLEGVAATLGLPPRKVGQSLADERFRSAFEHDLAVQQALVALRRLVMIADEQPIEAADGDRTRIFGDWRNEQPENLSWSQLRTITLPARHERTALSDAMAIIDQWEGGTSPWPAANPSGMKFYDFVVTSPATQ